MPSSWWTPQHARPRPRSSWLRAAGLVAAAGATCVAYGTFVEAFAFRLRRVSVPVLPPGQRPLRVLHVSDLHLTPHTKRRAEWVRGLAALEPDLVVNTGDNLGHAGAVPLLVDALGPLLELPGVFVTGTNDFFGPVAKNPLRYLFGSSRREAACPDLPAEELLAALGSGGWVRLDNARAVLEVDGRRLTFVGLHDPHAQWDSYPPVQQGTNPSDGDLHIGVVHAPYTRVLDQLTAEGSRLVLAGHTHGGQVCVPGWGALVSNCTLPPRMARGLHPWVQQVDDVHEGWVPVAPAGAPAPAAWLHVSAGLGMSPFTPFRFACPPEATLLTLTPRPAHHR